jgi:hypothetical protein
MPAQPSNPKPTEDLRAPRKRQVPIDANGEPVTGSAPKKRKSAPDKPGKKKPTPAKPAPQKKTALKSVPEKAAPAKHKPSVEIEDMANEDDFTYSEQPQNTPEADIESDYSNNYNVPPPETDVDADKELEDDDIEIIEDPEEDDEAELGSH